MEGLIFNLLQGLLNKLSSPIQEEVGLWWGMKKEHQKLKSNLLAIKAVLRDAEAREVKEEEVRDWLKKLKDVAYDADDLVDEFIVEALRRKVEIRDGMLKKVHNFFSPLNPLVFHFKMAHKMPELRKRLDEIAKEKSDFHFKEGVLIDYQTQMSRTRETHSFVDESEVYGRDDEKAKIIDSLINSGEDEVLSVISIVGMGGLGKTTLAQLAYNDESVAAHFDLKMWVYVSEDFDVGRLVKEILQSAMNNRSDPLSMDLLQTRLRGNLRGKRYLLVLDDVWNEVHETWDKLKTLLKCGAQGSKIIVTTRSNRVASIMGTFPAHHLGTLSENDSWSLFEKLAHPDPKLVSIGKEMVKYCGGVPLAIKTLGGLMSSKTSESEWLSVKNSELWESQDTDGGILPALRLSYNHLAPHLKQCFAYCAVFPKGHDIEKDKLIQQWVAQGFIQSDDENKLLEEKGEDFFNDLLSRSLFQVVEEDNEDNVISYKMHDLIHDLLRFVTETESFSVEVSTQIVPEETRHLSLCDCKWAVDLKNLESLEKCKKLHSLFLFDFIDVNVCSHFKCLKVLDLSAAHIGYLPNSLGKLKHLRYLDVSRARIKKLPETICNLHSLQTLKLYGINLKKLPKDIKRMTSLRHIEYDYDVEFPMPNGIGELTCLQTLPTFTMSQEGAGIEELKCLNRLRGKLCIKGLESIRNEKCAREAKLMEKQRLRSLSLSWFDVETIADTRVNLENVIENLEPHSNLKELSISNYMGLNFPSWIKKLTNLVEISLDNCNKCEHLLPLGQLPFLEALYISDMESVKYIFVFDRAYNDKDIFPSLKLLELCGMPNLEGWWPHQVDSEVQQEERHEQVLLGCLQTLEIRDCPKLKMVATKDILFSPALQRLVLSDVGFERIEMSTSQSLKAVHLSNMQHLEELPLQQALGLEELHAENCPRMIRLPHRLPSLKRLEIFKCNEMLLEFITNYFSLETLSIGGFPQVTYLPENIRQNDASLPGLEIDDCPKSISLSNMLKNLSTLKSLSISDFPDLMLTQDELDCLGSLQKLSISNSCFQQSSISGVLPSLRILELMDCKNLESIYCDGLQKVASIESRGCPKLWSFSSDWVRNLTSLDRAHIEGVNSLPESFGNLTSLCSLTICNSPDLTALPESIGNLKLLDYLCIFNCIGLKSLPISIGNLTSLTYFRMDGCNAIRSLPEFFGNMISLERLAIYGCLEMRTLPESIGNLTSLLSLTLFRLPVLTALPECIGNLKSLDDLFIHDCHAMRSLPESLGNLLSLTNLWIGDCPKMETLPVGLQSLTNLETLEIRNCPILKRRLLNKKKIKMGRMGKDWHKVAHVPYILIDWRDPRAYFSMEEESSDESNEEEHVHKRSSLLHCIG